MLDNSTIDVSLDNGKIANVMVLERDKFYCGHIQNSVDDTFQAAWTLDGKVLYINGLQDFYKIPKEIGNGLQGDTWSLSNLMLAIDEEFIKVFINNGINKLLAKINHELSISVEELEAFYNVLSTYLNGKKIQDFVEIGKSMDEKFLNFDFPYLKEHYIYQNKLDIFGNPKVYDGYNLSQEAILQINERLNSNEELLK